MNAMTHHQSEFSGTSGPAASKANTLSLQWSAVQDAAGAVALLAGITPEKASPRERNFPALIRKEPEWKRALAERGVSDLAAIMQPGVKALLAVNARGQNAAAAAVALWREYDAARNAILDLVPQSGGLGPDRSA